MVQVLRKVPQSSGQQRILFFHHAGGNGAQYFPALKSHASQYEIYCLDLPGRFFRLDESAFKNMQNLTKALIEQLSTLPPQPTYLMGHSFGSLVAYALAWELSKTAAFPLLGLGISALKAPSKGNREKSAKLAALSEEALLQEVEKFAPLPEIVKKEPMMMKMTLKALRDDFTLMASFDNPHAHERLLLPSIVMGGDSDSQVSVKDLETWSTLVETRNRPLLFPGHHFYIFSHFERALSNLLTLTNKTP